MKHDTSQVQKGRGCMAQRQTAAEEEQSRPNNAEGEGHFTGYWARSSKRQECAYAEQLLCIVGLLAGEGYMPGVLLGADAGGSRGGQRRLGQRAAKVNCWFSTLQVASKLTRMQPLRHTKLGCPMLARSRFHVLPARDGLVCEMRGVSARHESCHGEDHGKEDTVLRISFLCG